MIAVIIIILAVVIISACVSNGEWGPAAITAVIGLVLLIMGAGERKDARAWYNRREYWADGGPDAPKWKRDERKRYYEQQMPSPGRNNVERGVTYRELRDARKKRERFKEELASGEAVISKAPARVCHYCGRFVYASGQRIVTEEGNAVLYTCPRCGRANITRIVR